MRWQSVSPDILAWREFDGEVVVRNGATGNTHLLEPLASQVLLALIRSTGPLSVYDVARLLKDDNEPEGEWNSAVEEVLAEFKRLGLAVASD